MSRKNKPLSYGEAWFEMKTELNSMEVKFNTTIEMRKHLPRMNREDAVGYYNKKCKTAFEELGISKKVVKNDFEIRLFIILEKVRKNTNIMLVKEARKINREYFREVA